MRGLIGVGIGSVDDLIRLIEQPNDFITYSTTEDVLKQFEDNYDSELEASYVEFEVFSYEGSKGKRFKFWFGSDKKRLSRSRDRFKITGDKND